MIDKFFKAVFALFGLFTGIVLLIALFSIVSMKGTVDWTPLLVVGALVALSVYRMVRRNKRDQAALRERKATMANRIANRTARNDGIYERYDGHGAVIEMQKSSMIITRHGLGSFLTQGIKGEKTIPFHNITAVQFRDATTNMSGYIQFSLKGEIASGKGILDATLDENTVMFTIKQSADFNRLRDKIEALIETTGLVGVTSPASLADELTKLADLKDRGVLTEAEFIQQKMRLVA